MIELTQLSGKTFWLNPHQIETMEATPDTTIGLLSGKRMVVREAIPLVIAKIVEYRRQLGGYGNEE